MDKNKILESVQNTNKGKEFERGIFVKTDRIGYYVGYLTCIILFCIDLFAKQSFNLTLCIAVFLMSGVQTLYEGIKLKKAVYIIFSIFFLILAILALVAFILE